MVLIYKRVKWFLSNKKYYDILIRAIGDYNKGYFGQAPEDIR